MQDLRVVSDKNNNKVWILPSNFNFDTDHVVATIFNGSIIVAPDTEEGRNELKMYEEAQKLINDHKINNSLEGIRL